MEIQFETIEDINVKKISSDELDHNSESFACNISSNHANSVIQVKQSSVTNSIIKQIIFNWLLLEQSKYNIDKFILITGQDIDKSKIPSVENANELFKEICESDKKASATISKVKEAYQHNFEQFKLNLENILAKAEFTSIPYLDTKINESAEVHFRKAANEVVFNQRMDEFCQCINAYILDSISDKKAYSLKYKDFITIVENICTRINSKHVEPSYSSFKKANPIDLQNSHIKNTRQYRQLLACNLHPDLLLSQLSYELYYKVARDNYLDIQNIQQIEDIELTTFDNFSTIKFELARSGSDSPCNRLIKTQEKGNSYAANDQIKYGSSIYLTGDRIRENQISWKDEDNEDS